MNAFAGELQPTHRKLGGDDFDSILFEMAEAAGLADRYRVLEMCRIAKERLNPNTRKILLTLGNREICHFGG